MRALFQLKRLARGLLHKKLYQSSSITLILDWSNWSEKELFISCSIVQVERGNDIVYSFDTSHSESIPGRDLIDT